MVVYWIAKIGTMESEGRGEPPVRGGFYWWKGGDCPAFRPSMASGRRGRMEFVGFTDEDFAVFEVPGLAARMDALKRTLRPKLEQLGRDFTAFLTELLGEPMYAHVAKHARRTVNPPEDSWVAFAADRRGYKKHPHFQIGLWRTHAFATFGLISESPQRAHFAAQLRAHAAEVVAAVPGHFVWIPDHADPDAIPAISVDETALLRLADRLDTRQGELLAGVTFPRAQAVAMEPAAFEDAVKEAFRALKPLYRLTQTEVFQA